MQISSIAVVGAGQMGAGIAQVCAEAGYQVQLFDSVPGTADKGLQKISGFLQKRVTKGELSADQLEKTLSRLSCASDIHQLGKSNLVIEAIIENFEAKQKLFSSLDNILPPEAVFASNTSSISITKMASAISRPQQFIGIHFMNPVPIMRLVEIIRGLQTSDTTYATAQTLCASINKTAVLGIDTPGFIVNRILVPMINEAIFLLQEGVKAEDIDTAMKLGTNQPMGPLTLADFVGLDTLLYILRILHAELGEDKYRPCPLLIKYVEAGWHGKKSGRGFYTY